MADVLTPEHLDALRAEYNQIERIDPCQPSYYRLCEILDRASPEMLKQVAEADIKFISLMATNRLNRK
jgi:hypothetical protein